MVNSLLEYDEFFDMRAVMKHTSPYDFILAGLYIRRLLQSTGLSISIVIENSQKLSDVINKIGYRVSFEGLFQLRGFVKELAAQDDKEVRITSSQQSELSTIMRAFEATVYAESRTKKIFLVSEGRFNLEALLEKPDKLFKQGVFKKLPEIAQVDLTEGFLCLAFGRTTATAFHVLRATEATLKEYYLRKVRRKREKIPMWGNMVVGLKGMKKPDISLLQRLDFIRIRYRNPTNHPEALYTFEDAQDLLGICIEIVNAMAESFPSKLMEIGTPEES